MSKLNQITVGVFVDAPIEKVWQYFNDPVHITAWNQASDDWHTPKAENDLKAGGTFRYRMESKDGSAGFDFFGTYDNVKPYSFVSYIFGNRKASVTFTPDGTGVRVEESFDPETENPLDMQRAGWQSILESFKKYTETH